MQDARRSLPFRQTGHLLAAKNAKGMARPAAAANGFLNYEIRENARKSKAEARAF